MGPRGYHAAMPPGRQRADPRRLHGEEERKAKSWRAQALAQPEGPAYATGHRELEWPRPAAWQALAPDRAAGTVLARRRQSRGTG